MRDPVADISFLITAFLALASSVIALWRTQRKNLLQVTRWQDRLFGLPADPEHGLPHQPGLFEQVNTIQKQLEKIQQTLGPNNGKSILDKVSRLENYINSLERSQQ